MQQPRGIIFDFDGTILDTETPEYDAWKEIFSDYGVDLPIEVWATGVGIGMSENPFEPSSYLVARAKGPVDLIAVREQRHALFAERMASEGPRPGILGLLSAVQEKGLKIGLASSSRHDWVDGHLERLGLISSFPIRLCADDVTFTKPHPELYLRCLEYLGLSAPEVIALEDSPNGIRAAKAAGLFCVAFPNPLTSLLAGIDAADISTDNPANLLDLPLLA